MPHSKPISRISTNKEHIESLFNGYKQRESLTIDPKSVKDGDIVFVLSDTQIPFVDKALLDGVERAMGDLKPAITIYAGDILDFYEASDFDKDPRRRFFINDEIRMAKEMLVRHKALSPKGRRYFIAGNHEDRIVRMLSRLAIGAEDFTRSLEEVLDLASTCSGFVPYGEHIELLGFVVTHGTHVQKHSSYSARAHYDDYNTSGAHGHTHRLGAYSRTDYKGVPHTFYETGCLCILKLEYIKGTPNWQQGFLVGQVRNGTLYTELVRVLPNKDGTRGFVVLGRYYQVK